MKALGLLFPLLLGACSARSQAYDKQLAQINENIMILQSERDRLEERIAVLEGEREAVAQGRRDAQPSTGERPRLKVVQLAPPSDEPGGAVTQTEPTPAASTERTLIHGEGSTLSQSPVAPE